MKKILLACMLAIGLVFVQIPGVQAQTTTAKVLVLYDAPANDPYSKLGLAYAIMLRNLLGHFNTNVTLAPVGSYTAGTIENYQAAFYLGDYYDNLVPSAFLADVAVTNKTVVWFKYNLWQLAWNSAYNFTSRYGFTFTGLHGLASAPSTSNPTPDFFDTVVYKNMNMVKYYAFDANTGVVSADPDIGVTAVSDATKASALVSIKDSQTGAVAPYVMRSGNFWYFADMPFSYIGPRDRYLVICDLLHDILGTNQPVLHRAMVRFEDVNAFTTTSSMKSLTDYLYSLRIPFSIATIPLYMDPLGAYNNGVPLTVHLSQATGLKKALNYALARGGKIVMHGYTHQYNSTPNRENAVSGNDFEFWLATQNRPVDEDSLQWATSRLSAGLLEFTTNGYTPFAWETPHYQASPLAMKATLPLFKTTYQRVVYYTSDNPTSLNSTAANHDYAVGQFFPYIINNDYYGQRVLPENLGNIEYNICSIDPYSCLTYTWQDLYTNAQYALTIRDGFASFFFHPFWLEPDLGTPGLADFKSIVQGVTKLGFTWVSPDTVK
ncbi:DUF2334 domain-containing protein [Trinickia caryophylli]|uniref:Uncharacterized protein YdaL n=1 Tax=Trinickia caryophylli TaxID=28094 RepID=A0A1X7D1N1_TRICW|nr:DUF2334 domain-containing protein [Trinickia caryophylli]PMS13638.1 DUF2334 domain-containing protein [Trinickia caryophylli]TRX15243.1 DUF2334 domain-containing protein [Trinickia caryophylli]WQE15116.1 DUF2334 domain-containing protein [Trinickia caryophylli]SMF07073.1 Uncharacterized protein YdaL [Trinickia caryophylli]